MGEIAAMALFVVAGILVMGIIFIVNLFSEKRRTEEMQQVAIELSFDFIGEDKTFSTSLEGFHLASQGSSRRLNNLMRGTGRETEVSLFDYRYVVSGGKNSTTYNQTVVCFNSERLNLPDFELRPEHWFHKIGKLLGYRDIAFADYPQFSRTFILRSDNEQAVRDFFTTSIIEHLESLPGICVEGHGNRLLVYRTGRRVKPIEIRQFLETGFGIYTPFVHAGKEADSAVTVSLS